jgi:peptidoglycan/LPS O-acetylase OafA/YrhL
MTYPLYLLHQTVGFSIFNAAHRVVHPQVLLWSTVFIMLLASYAIHVWVERPSASLLKAALNRWMAIPPAATPRVPPANEPAAHAGLS